MDYLTLKLLHQATAYISVSLFILRWVWSFDSDQWRNYPILKIAPHINDTLLLALGILLAIWAQLSPFGSAPWLGVKIIALTIYIALGYVALNTQELKHRFGFGVAALIMFGFITMVATTKMIFPPFIY